MTTQSEISKQELKELRARLYQSEKMLSNVKALMLVNSSNNRNIIDGSDNKSVSNNPKRSDS